ncbi:hypothetical protein [Candidatus Sodalis pierantonius]|uniref:hypothetical protein n=1 Tax=Candidatus Sodalis pierantonii TaxID=1486991 RepID=UPI0011DC7348|nr:hypothetical protein [Candidatus Sodalis pierantonius]
MAHILLSGLDKSNPFLPAGKRLRNSHATCADWQLNSGKITVSWPFLESRGNKLKKKKDADNGVITGLRLARGKALKRDQ